MLTDLVMLAQQGDEAAFDEICRRFAGLVGRQARQPHLGPLGEDAWGEAWVALAEAVRTYDAASGVPFAGYAQSRVRYALWNLFKRERRRWRQEIMVDGGDEERTGWDWPDDTDIAVDWERSWTAGVLANALQDLPARQRLAVAATVIGGRRLADVAGQLGVTPQAVHNLRRRGLDRLKKTCAGMYGSEGA